MADDEPLKNCATCQFGEHFPTNGKPSKFLCTRDIGEYFGEYIWEDSEEIEMNFVCHQEPVNDKTNLQKMRRVQANISETVLSYARELSRPAQGDHRHGEGS